MEVHYPSRSVVLTRSGTQALELALRFQRATAGHRDVNHRVALPAWCCPDIGTAAIAAGSKIVLYDLDPHSLSPDLDSLECALKQRVDSVVLVQFFGRLVDPAAVRCLADRYGAQIVEDAAQGAGASLHGTRAGALTEIGITSFGRGKGRNAGGGGAIIATQPLPTHAPGTIGTLAELRLWSNAAAVALLGNPTAYSLISRLPIGLGQTHFVLPSPDYRLSRVVARLLPHALAREDDDAVMRRSCADQWREILEGRIEILCAPTDAAIVEGALRLPFLIDPEVGSRVSVFGVTKGYPRTLDEYPQIAMHMPSQAPQLPGARYLARKLHTLPTHGMLTKAEIETVAAHLTR